MKQAWAPIKLIEVDLDQPLQDLTGLEGFWGVQALVRVHDAPVGLIWLRAHGDCLPAAVLGDAIAQRCGWGIFTRLLGDHLKRPGLRGQITDVLDVGDQRSDAALPTVTVAVCTRDRPQDLALTLEALGRLDPRPTEILIVDNAPTMGATERLVSDHHVGMRYLREDRPGLDWARNRAIAEAHGAVVAFTDDDAIPDPGWVGAIAEAFAAEPEVVAVTGLVLPYELETEPQVLFELYGGFARGFRRQLYRAARDRRRPVSLQYGGTGRFGTGANMAFRRAFLEQTGGFDPALDVGTVTNGGGDLEMFFRVLKEGHGLLYEPRALVYHRHRREYAQLRTQIANNGVGFYSYLVRTGVAYPDERVGVIRLGLWWLWWWNLRRLWRSFFRPSPIPRDLIVAELAGSLRGLVRYPRARRAAAVIQGSAAPSGIAGAVRTTP